jgi:hypothetical protein
MAILSFVMMCISLALQGAYFWARDSVTPDPLPSAFFASDVVWVAAMLSLLFYRRWPWVTIAASWILFLTSAIVLRRYVFDRSLLGFVKVNSFVMTNLIFAHLGLYNRRRVVGSEGESHQPW